MWTVRRHKPDKMADSFSFKFVFQRYIAGRCVFLHNEVVVFKIKPQL